MRLKRFVQTESYKQDPFTEKLFFSVAARATSNMKF
jgi:hypothetical protein